MAWLRAPWRFYGVVCVVSRSGGYRGGFYGFVVVICQSRDYHCAPTVFSVRYGMVVISIAVLCFRFNYSKVVIILAILHHKVVALLREDQPHPTAHKAAASRVLLF